MDIQQVEAYQKKFNMAGTINQRDFHGCDMPMNARFIAKLPYAVLRRVFPERSLSDYLNIAARWSKHYGKRDFEYSRTEVNGSLRFVVRPDEKARCPDCFGSGEHDIGQHTYTCQECDGTGYTSGKSGVMACCVIQQNGEVEKHNSWEMDGA